MHFSRACFAFAALALVACGSSDSGGDGTSSSPSDPASANGGAAGSSGAGSCSCNVTLNGESKQLACGGEACVNGTTVTCGSGAQVSYGAACKISSAGADNGGANGSGNGGASTSAKCSLFVCEHSSIIAPCMSTDTGVNYLYEQEGSADMCSKGTTPTIGYTSNGRTTLCVPANCPEPRKFIQ